MDIYKQKFQRLFKYDKLTNKNIENFKNEYASILEALDDEKTENKLDLINSIFDSDILTVVVYNYLQATVFKHMADKKDEVFTDGHRQEKAVELDCKVMIQILKLTIKIILKILTVSPSNLNTIEHLIDRVGLISIYMKNDDEINTDLELLTQIREDCLNEQNAIDSKCKTKMQLVVDRRKPPENFRTLNIIPSLNEIKGTKQLFLRKNLTHGPYDSVEHYLDVQYRLLREDYVGSIREGIIEYLERKKCEEKRKMKFTQNITIRVYESVTVRDWVADANGGIVHRIKLNNKKRLKRIRWETSKRLIEGSLVCLSSDNFRTCFFATVFKRDCDSLNSDGTLLLKFINWKYLLNNEAMLRKMDFIMAETTAFFESYRYTLDSLKLFNENNFPFKQYIVYSNNETLNAPKYLTKTAEKMYDFSCILKSPIKFHGIKLNAVKNVPILDYKYWPTAKLLGLDDSQYEALKLALTKELVVIQGPPGTGKTYIGVQIVRMLMNNFQKPTLRRQILGKFVNQTGPILIVCYTNHALDQFLMLISKYLNGPQDIIRIGRRSKEPEIEKYSLFNVKRRFGFPEKIINSMKDNRDHLKYTVDSINSIDTIYTPKKSNQIFSYDLLKKHFSTLPMLESICDHNIRHFYAINKQEQYANKIFDDWLGLGNLPNTVGRRQMTKTLNEYKTHNKSVNRKQTIETANIVEEAQLENEQRELDDDQSKKDDVVRLFNMKDKKAGFKNEFISNDDMLDVNEKWNLFELGNSNKKYSACLKRIISSLHNKMSEDEVNRVVDLWELQYNDRLRFYAYLHDKYKQNENNINNQFEYLLRQYEQASREFESARDGESLYVMRNAKIIGMTTTGAAKNQRLISKLKPSIVIVEEAAEVFEAHIISCLTESCEQLILIGDNEQLQPSPNLYKLSKTYGLNVSLFERLVNNQIPKVRLNLQHRMRPEISEFMKNFYDDLIDDDIVRTYEHINGVGKNIYFINHANLETNDEDTLTKSNDYEAEYLIRLCDYLLKQNYKPDRITILVAYGGQLFLIKNKISKILSDKKSNFHHGFANVHVTPIDNYQGEENDIILLSLVRSNNSKLIGFLSISNRVCVAMSRAKKGFYLIGNFRHLAENSKLWAKIYEQAVAKGLLSDTLELYCQNHQDKKTCISHYSDFDKCPDGGCAEQCDTRLDCGHVCAHRCHVMDHSEFKCYKPCTKLFQNCTQDHKCDDFCYMDCKPCAIPVEKQIPTCGHFIKMKCSVDPSDYNCPKIVETTLKCGHVKQVKCYQLEEYMNQSQAEQSSNKNFECHQIVVKKIETCGHTENVACYVSSRAECEQIIEKVLEKCGHKINVKCSESSEPLQCMELVTVKLIGCQHDKQTECFNNHFGAINKMRCNEKIEIQIDCGHKIQTACSDRILGNKSKCQKKCEKKLDCGHDCSNKCGVIHSHSECRQICGKKLVCNHACQLQCGMPCYTCVDQCAYQCSHGTRCRLYCSDVCMPCKRPCQKSCKHKKCTKLCHETCDIDACSEQCDKILKCSHKCSSVCGEACICATCTKLNENKLYIRLRDCQCIIEIPELDKHVQESIQKSIALPSCPKCRTSLSSTTKRYLNEIKSQQAKFNAFKLKQYVKPTDIQNDLNKKIRKFDEKFKKQLLNYSNGIYCKEQLEHLYNRFRLIELFEKHVRSNKDSKYRELFSRLENKLLNAQIETTNDMGDGIAAYTLAHVFTSLISKCPKSQSVDKLLSIGELISGIEFNTKFTDDYFNQTLFSKKLISPANHFKISDIFKPVRSVFC